jgi:protein involved in polysaccharide export with SLBB domain
MHRFLSIFGRLRLNFCGLTAGSLFSAGTALAVFSITPIAAQILPPQMQQMLGPRGGQTGNSGSTSPFGSPSGNTDNNTVIIQPAGPLARQPRSMLEQILSSRAGVQLNQFGYNDLGAGRAVVLPQMGGVQEEYILGPGDEIVVTLRGQEAGEYRTFVDRSGRVILPKLNPINVAGRSFGSFREDLAAAVQRAYVATEAFASLGSVRQIRVTVGGEVNNPGLRVMTGLASAMDAILVSSGVKKTGSLRNIHILRGGRRINVDLYGVLRGTGGAQLPLVTDGDRIIVNPLGATVAITGPVRVPAIYELAPGQPGMTAASLIAMAGGYTVRGRYDLTLIGLGADGRTNMSNLSNDRTLLRDSDVLIVRNTADQTTDRATLQAGAGNGFTGTYAAPSTRLSSMLRAPGVLGDDPYPLFAVISRRDPVSLLRTLVAVTPSAVMAGRQDFSLQSDDIVHTFTRTEAVDLIRAISWFDERRRRLVDRVQTPGSIPLLGRPEELPPRPNRQEMGDDPNRDPLAADAEGNVDPQRSGPNQFAGTDASSSRINAANGIDGGIFNDNSVYNNNATYNDNSGYYDGYAFDPANPSNTNNNRGGGNNAFGETGQGSGGVESLALSSGGGSTFGRGDIVGGNVTSTSGANDPRAMLRQPRPDPTARYRRELSRVQRLADSLKVEPAIAANFLQEHLVTLNGAIRGSGNYLVGPDLPLSTLVQAAGGTLNWSDKTGVERVSTVVDVVTGRARTTKQVLDINQQQFATTIVRPKDSYRFPEATVQLLAGVVTLKGEVRRPGVYNVVRGERLSDILVRAGGLTEVAYPYGAVFLRKSVAAREMDGFQRAARELESQLTVSLTRTVSEKQSANPALNYPAIRALVNDLRSQQALGRISIVADPAVLATRPQVDFLVEEGDVLYIPSRPATVTVLGEVMNSTSFPSQPNMTVEEYINRAGGYGRYADESLTFVVLPDGTARQVEKSWFAFGKDSIPPGSTIVVPKDVNPLELRQLLVDGTQILSQLAIAAASLAVLSK